MKQVVISTLLAVIMALGMASPMDNPGKIRYYFEPRNASTMTDQGCLDELSQTSMQIESEGDFRFNMSLLNSKGLGSTFRVCEMVIDPYGWTNEPKYTFHKVKVVPMYTAMNVDDKKTKL